MNVGKDNIFVKKNDKNPHFYDFWEEGIIYRASFAKTGISSCSFRLSLVKKKLLSGESHIDFRSQCVIMTVAGWGDYC